MQTFCIRESLWCKLHNLLRHLSWEYCKVLVTVIENFFRILFPKMTLVTVFEFVFWKCTTKISVLEFHVSEAKLMTEGRCGVVNIFYKRSRIQLGEGV